MRWKDITAPDCASLEEVKAYAHSLGVELEVEMNGEDDITLGWIKRAPRRIGSGAMVLDALTAYADKIGATISLCVTDQRGKNKLVSYYESHGFHLDELTFDHEPMMTYFPPER